MKTKTTTWWIGWVVSSPIRIVAGLTIGFVSAFIPSLWYADVNLEYNEENWDKKD